MEKIKLTKELILEFKNLTKLLKEMDELYDKVENDDSATDEDWKNVINLMNKVEDQGASFSQKMIKFNEEKENYEECKRFLDSFNLFSKKELFVDENNNICIKK